MEHKKVDEFKVTEEIAHMKTCMEDIEQHFTTNPDDAKVPLSELMKRFRSVATRVDASQLSLMPERDMRKNLSLFCPKECFTTEEMRVRMSESLNVPASMREGSSFYGLNASYEPPDGKDIIILGSMSIAFQDEIFFPVMRYTRLDNGVLVCDIKSILEKNEKWDYTKHLFLGGDGTTKHKRAV